MLWVIRRIEMCSLTEPDVFNIVFVQSMAELLAENYHNIWARKKKMELEAKGRYKTHSHTVFPEHFPRSASPLTLYCCNYLTNQRHRPEFQHKFLT